MYYSQALARYLLNLDYKSIPMNVVNKAKSCILDTIGVALAGSDTAWSKSIVNFVRNLGHSEESTLIGFGDKAHCAGAASANGTMSDSYDWSDENAVCHIGAVVIPASLAMAEKLNADGRSFITSVVAGYDIMARVSHALGLYEQYSTAFHPTATCGVFGSAAASAKLLELEEDKIVSTLGIAGSYASGLMEFLADGSMTKRFHPGKAAHDGIVASLQAQEGLTGPVSVFEGERGFLNAYSGNGDATQLVEEIGKDFKIVRSAVKFHSCCAASLSSIDAVLEIVQNQNIQPEDIEKIIIKMRTPSLRLVYKKASYAPQTVLDAQMSLPYCIAVAILDGRAFVDQFSEERLKDPQVLGLAKKVEAEKDPAIDAIPATKIYCPARATLTTKDGRTYSSYVKYSKGEPENPLSTDELHEKFRYCALKVLGQSKTDELIEVVSDLDKVQNLNELTTLLF